MEREIQKHIQDQITLPVSIKAKKHIMKNLLFTLTLLFSLHSFGQDYSHSSNPVSDVIILTATDYQGVENAAIVPEGKYWTFTQTSGGWYWGLPNLEPFDNIDVYDVNFGGSINIGQTALPAGHKLFYFSYDPVLSNKIIIYEHNLISDSSMGYNDFEPFKDRIKLFPNPTTSEVALNSDKDYQIEVFDLLGNKVMELTGNTIDMEHLSRATYIVNALDLETQESLSYKIIKK